MALGGNAQVYNAYAPHFQMFSRLVDSNGTEYSGANPIPVNASVSASIAPFAPKGKAVLAVSNVSSRVALPTADISVCLRNTGSTDAYFKLGGAGVVAAAVTDFLIKAGDIHVLDVTGNTFVAGITSAGSTAFEIWTGTGLNSPAVAGTGGSASTVAIDQSNPGVSNAVDVTNFPVTVDTNNGAASASTTRQCLANNNSAIANWGHGATGAAVPTGATYVGMNVAGNLTGLTGTANGLKVDVQALVALPAGANIIGKVGFDNSTPGTTNAVSLTHLAGTAVATSNGVVSAGVQRTAIASDNSAVALWGHGVIGTAAPANATYFGLLARTTNPAAATDGNMVGPMADKLGRQVVVIGQARDLKGDAQLTLTSTTAETTLITAVASTFLDVYGMIVENISGTVCEVEFRDDTAGTLRFSIEVPANDTRGFMLPSSDGYKQTTVNKNWTAKCITSVASIKISALYVKNI